MFHHLEQKAQTQAVLTVEREALAEVFHEKVYVEGLGARLVQENINGLSERPRPDRVCEELAESCPTVFIESIYVETHVEELSES